MRGPGTLVAALAFLVPAGAANVANTLELAPTMLQLEPGHAALFYLANRGSMAVNVQIDAFDWRQTDKGDRLAPSSTLFVSPPFATIAPNTRQTVRVLAQPHNSSRETQYRLLVSQLPNPEKPNSAAVRILLQFSIPVFAANGPASPPQLSWNATIGKTGIMLVARNTGERSIKLENFRITQGGEPLIRHSDRLGYILPGCAQSWRLDAAKNAPIHIEAKDGLSGGAVTADVTLQR